VLQSRCRSPRLPRAGLLLFGLLIAVGVSPLSLAAYPDAFGPQLTVSANVAERGTAVMITLNAFPPGQSFSLAVRPASAADQDPAVAILPVTTDASGSGSAILPTDGLATGDYAVSIAGVDIAALNTARALFGVIDPGTVGPRGVHVGPVSSDDEG
jgi:hypothetical protein